MADTRPAVENTNHGESVLYTLPPPPQTTLSVRNLTLVANRSGSKFLRKLKSRRRRTADGEKVEVDEEKEQAGGRTEGLGRGKGVDRDEVESGGNKEERGYVGEARNDRPIEERDEEKEDEEVEKTDDGRKVILNDVSCECLGGELLAM